MVTRWGRSLIEDTRTLLLERLAALTTAGTILLVLYMIFFFHAR